MAFRRKDEHEDDFSKVSDDKTEDQEGKASLPNKLPIWNNSKVMNLPDIMYKNILQSQYFKDLYEISVYHEAIEEIISSVNNLLPTKGLVSNQPSDAMCLLYKLFTLKLTKRQLEGMLSHKNVYVKAMALLYVRLTIPPKYQWIWYKNFIDSEQKIEYLPKEVITLGEFTIGIIREQRFLKTLLFPRIPSQYLTEMNQKIENILRKKRRESPDSARKRDGRKRARSPSPGDYRESKRGRSGDKNDQREKSSSPPRSPPESRFSAKPIVE
jgi:pre-mRNA-splicing factor 38B